MLVVQSSPHQNQYRRRIIGARYRSGSSARFSLLSLFLSPPFCPRLYNPLTYNPLEGQEKLAEVRAGSV